MRVLVTGAAGFIGFHLSRRFLAAGFEVDGYDGMTTYYDIALKQARWAELERHPRFRGRIARLEDAAALFDFIPEAKPDIVVHLAAQASARDSLENPRAHVDANLVGTYNVIEAARGARHFILASTSSVYGAMASVVDCMTLGQSDAEINKNYPFRLIKFFRVRTQYIAAQNKLGRIISMVISAITVSGMRIEGL